MQWRAIYNKETGLIRCTVATAGDIEVPENEGVIFCQDNISGATHKVNLETLQFENLPMLPETELTQEAIDVRLAAIKQEEAILLAQKAELEQ
jgi:hypothetical protein